LWVEGLGLLVVLCAGEYGKTLSKLWRDPDEAYLPNKCEWICRRWMASNYVVPGSVIVQAKWHLAYQQTPEVSVILGFS